ncbi:uncharacterized protein LOC130825238 [Amaranthus tricolor]|uniref:uncharacterized protein LOC130825238 n=1 Tax=Amaranthus tricolor TaxID=29722 RepID=UPI0025846F11|nr:uncharacterized protein LOC130825238 [Amaranthus tricolor]
MGGLRNMRFLKIALPSILILILCVFPVRIESQRPAGCSFEGLQLDKCFNQEGQYVFFEPCCRAINQAVRVGFHCLCTILTTNTPQFTTLLSLSMSSCYLMIPPLTMCRDLGTMPISLPLPPNTSSNEFRGAQQTALVPQPPSWATPQADGIPLNSSSLSSNSTHVKRKNVTSMLHVVENANNVSSSSERIYLFCFYCWLVCLAFHL